ncbi:MAG: coiled-coil domain-containing protein 22 [Firmicutes bacterium]|nr:coiled-coil domain-containing protein 22 [Bacillota bacterium]
MLAIAIVALAFAVLVAMFAIQNSDLVSISFFRWQLTDISLAVVILGSAAAGALAVGLFTFVREIGLRLSLRSCNARLDAIAKELDETRENSGHLDKEVERLKEEIQAKAKELETEQRRVSALQVELEATQAMEVLPEPQNNEKENM